LAALSQAEERELWRENTLMMREALRKNLHSRRKLKDQLGAFSETVAMELYRMWSIPLPANGGRWNDTDLTYLIPRLEHPDPTVRVTAMQTLQLGGMKEWTGDPVTHPQQWSTAVRRWRSLHEQHPDQPR
jgi:hypothetical protein